MGISRYCLCSWLAAALAAPTAAAQQPPATTAPLRPVYVNLRLDPDLGEALPEIRAALLGLGSARIAEPADYEITTKRDFPQSLIAVDAQQPQSDWRNDFTTDPVRPAPRTVELGNLALGDFTARLRGLVDRRDRANRLLVRGLAGATAKVDTCLFVYPRSPEPHDCHSDSLQARAAADPVRAELDGETIFTASMLNRSARPRYTALLVVDPSAGIMRVPLNADGDKKPLAPGARVDSDLINLGYSSGYIMLVTVDSDHPIDTSALEQISLDEPEWDDCLPVEARCARPEFAIPPEWSVSVAEYHYNAPTLVGIGGGMAVTDGMAPWMAEIYSTVPFTPKEFADDLRAPEHERKHLARRSKQELDHRCGGTLIAANLVLTAAHCVASEPFAGGAYPRVLKDRRVRIGTKRLGMGGTTLAIAGVAVPTGYTPGRQEHDIALLLLRPDRDTRRFAEERVRLGEKPIAPGTGVTAFGWGYTGVVAPDANPLFNIAEQLQRNPDQLRYGQMQALAWGACKRRLKAKLGSGMVCVVAPETETGAAPDTNVFSCRGDSGGPLVRKIGGVEELVGVTSWSLGCGYKDIPSVYTDVTKYRRWIEAAKRQLKPGAALRVDEKAAPSREEGRRQAAQ